MRSGNEAVARRWALPMYVLVVVALYFASALVAFIPGRIWTIPSAALTIAIIVGGTVFVGLRPIPARLVIGIAGLLALATAILGGTLGAVATAIALTLLAYGLGSRVIRALAPSSVLTAGERSGYAVAVGFGVLSYSTLAIALLGILSLVPVVALLLLVGILTRREIIGGLRSIAVPRALGPGRLATPLAFLMCALSLLLFLQALAPETQFDSLSYHLGLVREYLAAGRLLEIPEQPQSYYFLGAEMNFALAMIVGGQVAAKLLTLTYLGLAALGLYSFGSAVLSPRAAAIGTALFVAAPAIAWEATTTYVDGIATTYVFFAATLAYRARANGDPRLGILAGTMAGLAVATKLTTVLAIIPIAAFLGYALLQQRDGPMRRVAVAFGLAGVAAAAPWPILRFVQTGNPVFPLLNGVFRSPLWPPVNETFDLARFGVGQGTGLLELPLVVTLDAGRFVEGMTGAAIGVCLLLAPLAVLYRHGRPAVMYLMLVGLGTFVAWAATFQYLRYVLPMIAPLSLLAGLLLAESQGSVGRAFGRVIKLAPAAVILSSIVLLIGDYRHIPELVPYGVTLGREPSAEFLARTLPTYVPLQMVAQTAGRQSYVLVASCSSGPDDQNRLYAPGRLEGCESPWSQRLYRITDDVKALAALHERGVTHLLLNRAGMRGEMARAAAFQPAFLTQHADAQYRSGPIELYRLRRSP